MFAVTLDWRKFNFGVSANGVKDKSATFFAHLIPSKIFPLV